MKFSIVIPAKNEAEGLASILPSLKKIGAAEIIVVSDGSTDDTEKICKEFGGLFTHIRWAMERL